MPPLILIPVAYAGLRIITSAAVDQKVTHGVGEAASSAIRQITRILVVSLAEMSVNILIFLILDSILDLNQINFLTWQKEGQKL
jgi:hypothetical protein